MSREMFVKVKELEQRIMVLEARSPSGDLEQVKQLLDGIQKNIDLINGQYRALNARVGKALKKE